MKKKVYTIISILIFSALIYFAYNFFVKNNISVKPNDMGNVIVVTSPIKNAQISSPLRIVGRARGKWFFEGSFPVILKDAYGNTIASGNVTAQEKWTTVDFVPFLGTLQFNNFIKGSKGVLVLKKGNSSGDKDFDESIEIPIVFK